MSTYAALFIQLIGVFMVAQVVVTAPSSVSQDESDKTMSTNIYGVESFELPIPQNLTTTPCWVPYVTVVAQPTMTWWGTSNRNEWADAKACLLILKSHFQRNCASEATARAGAYVCGIYMGSDVVVTSMDSVFEAAMTILEVEKIPDGKTWETNIGNKWAIGITIDFKQDYNLYSQEKVSNLFPSITEFFLHTLFEINRNSNVNGALALWRAGSHVNAGSGTARIGYFATPAVRDEMSLAYVAKN